MAWILTMLLSVPVLLVLLLVGAAVLIGRRFNHDMALARAHAAQGAVLLATRCGVIEYQEAGTGVPLLVVHGSGGGHDQGMACAGKLAQHGVRAIAMSRFGHLGTPMPADASAPAQANAHVCLLDALGVDRAAVMGGSTSTAACNPITTDKSRRRCARTSPCPRTLTLPLSDVVHSHSSTRLSLPGPRASFLQTSSG